MKAKIFYGNWMEAQQAFDQWAKGKMLTRDVIVHEQLYYAGVDPKDICLMIIVYHPDDPFWDKIEE